jgi:hypothetical protein
MPKVALTIDGVRHLYRRSSTSRWRTRLRDVAAIDQLLRHLRSMDAVVNTKSDGCAAPSRKSHQEATRRDEAR